MRSSWRRHATAAVALVACLAACSRERPAAEEKPVPVRVRTPASAEQPESVSVSGSVEGSRTVPLAFQVAGRVARVYVEEGDAVRAGQLLAELDATDYRNALNAALGQAQAAEAVAKKAVAGPRPEEVEQARIDFERWQDEYQRMRFLFERKSLPANDFRKVEAAYNAGRVRYEMARQGTRAEDIAAAEAQAKAAQAQVEVARKRLEDTRLTAPSAGYIAQRRIEPGVMVAAGTPVLAVVDLDPVEVRVGVPEAEIGKVRHGAAAEIAVPSLGGRRFQGKVEKIGVAAEPTSRTYPVTIAVPNPERVLLAGMVAEARILGARTTRVLTIPGEAVVRDPQGVTLVYVYFPDRKRVYARRVELGAPVGRELEVRSGLRGDEQVVVAGQQKLREGMLVEVLEDEK